MRRTSFRIVACAVAFLLLDAFASTASASPAPADQTGTVAASVRAESQTWSPPGANDWSCRPSAKHPTPVILVHGTFGDSRTLLEQLSAKISTTGYCVYSLDYGHRATQPIEESAAELATFVDRVMKSTGARKVSLVGHSQGGMMPRYYIKNLGGAAKVDDLVGIAPSNYGTRVANLLAEGGVVGTVCQSCSQQAEGSKFLQRLNSPDDSPGKVSYTNIVTRNDTVVVPYTNGYLNPDRDVRNIRVQDICPLSTADHVLIPTDRTAIDLTLDALSRRGPANPNVLDSSSCAP